MLEHLRLHLKGKVIILGIGNTLRSDDGAGSILACRIEHKVDFIVWDAGANPENYLGKTVKESPDTLIIIDAVDSGVKAGEYQVLEASDLKAVNLFTTHNASLALTINYLQSQIKVDIIILTIQPKTIVFGDKLSPEVTKTIEFLEGWFSCLARNANLS